MKGPQCSNPCKLPFSKQHNSSWATYSAPARLKRYIWPILVFWRNIQHRKSKSCLQQYSRCETTDLWVIQLAGERINCYITFYPSPPADHLAEKRNDFIQGILKIKSVETRTFRNMCRLRHVWIVCLVWKILGLLTFCQTHPNKMFSSNRSCASIGPHQLSWCASNSMHSQGLGNGVVMTWRWCGSNMVWPHA